MGLLARVFATKAVQAAIAEIAEVLIVATASVIVGLVSNSKYNNKQIEKKDRKNNVLLFSTN